MEKTKENRAITLVALIVTIIILLILAGISVSLLTQTVLFEKAKNKSKQEPNSKEVAEWFEKGENYYYGKNGITQNYSEAFKWFKKAAEHVV